MLLSWNISDFKESDDHAEEEVAHTDEEDDKEGILEVDEEEDIDEPLDWFIGKELNPLKRV